MGSMPILTVGLNEEVWNVLPMVLFVFVAPTVVNGVRDGMVYGRWAVSGSTWRKVPTTSRKPPGLRMASQALLLRCLSRMVGHLQSRPPGHAGASRHGAGGASTRRLTGVLAPLAAYLHAAITHTVQDSAAGGVITTRIAASLMKLQGLTPDRMDPMNPGGAVMPWVWRGRALEMWNINIVILPILSSRSGRRPGSGWATVLRWAWAGAGLRPPGHSPWPGKPTLRGGDPVVHRAA